jgi:hypothetical protein
MALHRLDPVDHEKDHCAVVFSVGYWDVHGSARNVTGFLEPFMPLELKPRFPKPLRIAVDTPAGGLA